MLNERPHTVVDTFDQTEAASVPTIPEIQQHFKAPGLPNEGLFWSSGGTQGDWVYLSNAYAKRPNVKRFTLDLFWKDTWYVQQTDNRTHTPAEIHEFWNRASEAYADLNLGTAYVLLPKSSNPTEWLPTSTWAKVEYPTLTKKGTRVQKICRVNYDYAINEYAAPIRIWPSIDIKQC